MLARFFCFVAALFLLASGQVLTASETTDTGSTWDGSVFRITDTKTRVSLASVLLSVSDLKPENGNLVGEYTIDVPLMKSKNDKGKIVLPLNRSMHDIGAKGGILKGEAISYKEGKTPNLIVCKIIPKDDQRVLLDITTDDRTLKFKSKYTIVKTKTDS